jgi:tetratricopeptide (TPR) repeat protein
LLAYYQAAGDRRQFAATLERCEHAEIPAQTKALLLAQGYQLLGRAEQAIGHYRSALAKDPDNTDLKFRLATVLLGFDPAQAEVLLRELRRQLPQSVAARRLLAIALASHRSESAWPEIKELLSPGDSADGDDLRLAAMLRLQQQDPSQAAEARQLFERAAQRSAKTTAQDLMILALLCEQQQDLAAARRYIDSALRKPDASPAHLAQAAEFHLRQREPDAALRLCDRLDNVAPGDWGVRRLRAMALHAADKQPELEALLQECEQTILKQPAAEQAMLRVGFAQIYDSLQDAEHAEAQLRRAVALDEKRIGELTSWLLRAKQPEAALQACLELAEQKPSAAAQLAVVQVLSRSEIESIALRNRAEDCIRNSIAASKNASVLIALAELRLAQKNHDEAVKLFERAIATAPEHYVALNNIAALLADRVGQQQLALQYIDRALAAAPQRYPFLCDTRAKVLLYAGQPEAAIRELEAMLERAPQSDPRFHAHLAFAYADAGRERQARQALARANEQGLKLDDLTPGDRQRLRALDAQLANAKSASNSTEPATP